ncbi:MAG: hypothetical protein LBI45_05250 [Bacteroidales bacterium]|jgi:hypothetical protein|nr:hypothetical protein [Bacteroidales bacterium]
MNKQRIENYFSGTTTHKEELEIIHYFSSENIDSELILYQKYFLGLEELKTNIARIIPKEEYENFAPSSKNHTYSIKRWVVVMAVAASLTLLLMFFPNINSNKGYVVINGKKYTDEKHIALAFNTALENVKLDTKQIFNDYDDDLFN